MTMDKIIDVDSPDAFIEEIEKLQNVLPERINANPQNADKGLVKLVLTLVELVRKLLEKQAIRRIDAGSLSEEEIERVGETLMKLENKMQELKAIFGLKDEELNINLGPLGDLM
ncbi:MAG: gas vesicle protein K [Candidatus Omnitrophota bacterium]